MSLTLTTSSGLAPPAYYTIIGTSALTGYSLRMALPLASAALMTISLQVNLNDGVIKEAFTFTITEVANNAPTMTGSMPALIIP